MTSPNNLIDAMIEIIDFFLSKSSDTASLNKIKSFALNKEQWKDAHELFNEIREKTNKAIDNKNEKLASQYSFEEICAKTLYNMYCSSYEEDGAFDSDSPFWILPLAINHARIIGVKNIDEISSLLKI